MFEILLIKTYTGLIISHEIAWRRNCENLEVFDTQEWW